MLTRDNKNLYYPVSLIRLGAWVGTRDFRTQLNLHLPPKSAKSFELSAEKSWPSPFQKQNG